MAETTLNKTNFRPLKKIPCLQFPNQIATRKLHLVNSNLLNSAHYHINEHDLLKICQSTISASNFSNFQQVIQRQKSYWIIYVKIRGKNNEKLSYFCIISDKTYQTFSNYINLPNYSRDGIKLGFSRSCLLSKK